MSQLTTKTRAQLRNAAFAYIDSKGRRRLPIHDEAHVRNALARFNQTKFEDDAARERARKRLLTAAKKYANLLDDVRRLLRRAVQRSGGKEVDIRADELFAVFKRPSGALAAALAIQRSVGARSWPAGAKVRLRIGIHTGRPALTDGGYVGLAVNTAARICSAGHGGQKLLSSDAVRAGGGSAPPQAR